MTVATSYQGGGANNNVVTRGMTVDHGLTVDYSAMTQTP